MECNKDDALRAKEIAKQKFLANDISGAKKFAVKAQNLYPELEGIPQMLATFDVHLAGGNRVNGEIDWYGVLGVNPEANDEKLRKQYRKLAMMLHPDKNKSPGAEVAFKYVSQARVLYLDKAKRAEYDQKRKLDMYKKPGISSSNGFNKTSCGASKVKNSKRGATQAANTAYLVSSHKPDSTFWTVCHSCRTQYEYLRVYLNHNLLCPNCHKAFLAVETAPPGSGSIRRSFSEHQWHTNQHAGVKNRAESGRDNTVCSNFDSYSQTNFQWGVYASSVGLRRDEGLHRKNSKRTSGAAKRSGAMENTGVSNIPSNMSGGAGGHNLGGVINGLAVQSSGKKDVSHIDIQKLLMKKVKHEIFKKLKEPDKDTEAQSPAKIRRTDDEKDGVDGENASAINESETLEVLSMDVPGPDFCNFDKDRTEMSFGNNQVWAAYDDFDGMPRRYGMIHDVISLDSFKIRVSWLIPKHDSEITSSNWLGSGFSTTCGEFSLGKFEIYKLLDSFSHKVKWTRGPQGEIRIYPRKGDVWALYRNWSSDWACVSEHETSYKYDVVEVVEGYSKDLGVSVVPLLKVAGFRAVFHHHLDPRKIWNIPREELSRFSHQIPSYLLTGGQEAPISIKGSRELDPAAMPVKFLQVIVYGKDEDFVDANETETEKDEMSTQG